MNEVANHSISYWKLIWKQFCHHRLGLAGLGVVVFFCLIAIYAPLLASSKPLVVYYDGHWFFPLFRYLIYQGFYTKKLDIFFNLLIFTFPLMVLALYFGKGYRWYLFGVALAVQIAAFLTFGYGLSKDPSHDSALALKRMELANATPNWSKEADALSPYGRLNMVLRYTIRKEQQLRLEKYTHELVARNIPIPTLWKIDQDNEAERINHEEEIVANSTDAKKRVQAEATINYIKQRQTWLNNQSKELYYKVMPLLRPFHWEEDAGGGPALNEVVDWLDLTRINRKDLTAALIFGVRISLTVGLISIALALLIGIPVGALAGYYGGTVDIAVSRLLEIWESMPTFFMLLMVVAVTQSKSIFLVIAIIGIFGWTGFSRYIRGEFFKQRNLSYVEACHSMGFSSVYIMFNHILPNAIPPLLTLLPFAIMGAITSEAGLSFLGLGEEGSCSWGVLMDEGRSIFPGESYLLWAPALLLTLLLVAIALVGDALRDALDPKMHRMVQG